MHGGRTPTTSGGNRLPKAAAAGVELTNWKSGGSTEKTTGGTIGRIATGWFTARKRCKAATSVKRQARDTTQRSLARVGVTVMVTTNDETGPRIQEEGAAVGVREEKGTEIHEMGGDGMTEIRVPKEAANAAVMIGIEVKNAIIVVMTTIETVAVIGIDVMITGDDE